MLHSSSSATRQAVLVAEPDSADAPRATRQLGPRYFSVGEEIANSITHGLGAVLSVAGLAVLVGFATRFGSVRHVLGVSIYGASLVLLYTASTLYHSVWHLKAKKILRTLDHSAIFLLIAGTYTPFTLVNLNGPWGWTLLSIVWTVAVAGIGFKLAVKCRFEVVGVLLYIAMGWVAVVAAPKILAEVATGGLILLVLGGLAYTFGVVFYLATRLPYHHALWHVCVLAGSILHFFAVLFFVIPVA